MGDTSCILFEGVGISGKCDRLLQSMHAWTLWRKPGQDEMQHVFV